MAHRTAHRVRAGWRSGALAVLAAGGLLAATGCGGPGSSSSSTTAESTGAVAKAATCGTAPVTLKGYFETGFPLPKKLADEFTKQYPNVKWDIREDQFAVITQNAPRVLADDPPDLMRLPQVSELVKDHLLKNLDGYAKGFGWDKWPASQLEQMRVNADGTRGEGPLYAMGLNFSMTGVFYNKKLAAQAGMTAAADDPGRVRRRAAEGEAGRHHADRPVQRRGDRRAGLPAAEPDDRLRRPRARSTTGSSRRRAPRSTRRPT